MTRRSLLMVFVACALPRLLALAIWPADPDTLYYALSTGLVRDHLLAIDGGVTARIEPFYPLALAAGRLFTGDHPDALIVLQILGASAGGVLLFLFTREQTGSVRAAWIAALLYAGSPYLIRQSVAFMEVTIATVLLIVTAYSVQQLIFRLKAEATRPPTFRLKAEATGKAEVRQPAEVSRRAIPWLPPSGGSLLVGVLLAAIVLTRFSFLPIAVGALLLILLRAGATRAALTCALAVICVLPWLLFNSATAGTLVPPRIGENLFVSTSEYARPIVPTRNVDLLLPLADELVRDEMIRRGHADYDLTAQDRLLCEWAIAFVRRHPAEAIAMKAKNLAYIFQPRLLPFYEMSGRATLVDGRLEIPDQPRRPWIFELVSAAFQALLLVGGVVGLAARRARWRDDAFLILVAATIVGVQTVFFPTSRLLAPMTFVLIFYTAVSLDRLVNRRGDRSVQPAV
jgi:glycerol uptake facilitator-like aquaporin